MAGSVCLPVDGAAVVVRGAGRIVAVLAVLQSHARQRSAESAVQIRIDGKDLVVVSGIDDCRAGACAGDGHRTGNVQVGGGISIAVLYALVQGQVVGSKREIDGVAIVILVGLGDRVAQAARLRACYTACAVEWVRRVD